MRKLKRITALILSVLMLMSMSVAAGATDNTTTYTLVVKSSGSGYTYTAYQVFTGTYDGGLLKNIDWSSNINDTAKLSGKTIYQALAEIRDGEKDIYPFTQDNTSTGTPWYSAATVAAVLSVYDDKDDVVQQFAEVVAKYFVTSPTVYKESTSETVGEYTYYTFSGLAAGYYLIKTTGLPTNEDGSITGAYSRYILAMTTVEEGGTVSEPLEAKYDLPKLDKDLDDTDANIGDTITYYLTASLPTDYDSYSTYKLIFHDTPSSGLTYNAGSVEVYVYTNETDATAHTNGTQVYTGNYAVSSDDTSTNTSFTVTITDTKSLTTDGTTPIATDSSSLIQAVFTATLNSNAVVGGDGNPNEVYLEYSNDMYGTGTGKTVPDKVITWTYELDVTKIDADTKDTSDEKKLEGAQFVLYRLNDIGRKEYVIVDNINRVNGWDTDETKASTLESDSTGVFKVIGLDIGTYYLVETKAPSGYNKMSDEVEIVIAAEHTTIETIDKATYASYTDTVTWLTDDATKLDELTVTMTVAGETTNGDCNKANGTVAIKVTNNTGAALPSTGGIGTTIFYIVGGVLVVGAIILLITKKRMGGDDK